MENKIIPNEMKIKGKHYLVVPEKLKGYCRGCDFEFKNPNGCNSKLTDICRQGYRFVEKKLK